MPELVSSNPVNTPNQSSPSSRSRFNLRQLKLMTNRFADLQPHMVLDVVPDDKRFMFQSEHAAQSYTLRAPLMQDISLKKDYFLVDRRAILPRNWDKIYTAPKLGNDVDASLVGTSVSNFVKLIGDNHNALQSYAVSTATTNERITALMYYWLINEYFYSRGSLLASLGCNLASCWRVDVLYLASGYSTADYSNVRSFDLIEDLFFTKLRSAFDYWYDRGRLVSFEIDNVTYGYVPDWSKKPRGVTYGKLTFDAMLAMMRDSMAFRFYIDPSIGIDNNQVIDLSLSNTSGTAYVVSKPEYPIDLARLFAYQICCHHYYTNDNVDYVYSAELYRQLVGYWCKRFLTLRGNLSYYEQTFTLNGIDYEYDYLSAHHFVRVWDATDFSTFDTTSYADWHALATYYRLIFGFNRSLRYMDYFIGARTRPLAVGDTTIPVNNNLVSVLDVTKRIQMQRALNAVNRLVSRQLPDWVKGIFGVESPKPDFHDPIFLARTEDNVYTTEVENTASEQVQQANSVTARFVSNASRYAFDVEQVDYPSIVIGITHFEIERAYKDYIERPFFHVDRYDMFNPYLQYIGDQPIYESEINPTSSFINYFGYTNRHMEYKQLYPEAFGGFADFLPGYAFVGEDLSDSRDYAITVVNPDIIRSWNFELDNFYVSLTGKSPASYFHFIVKNINKTDISRPMAFNPTIL